jgi:hypothetical protein
MVWVPGTDYPPAQQHVGYPVSVLAPVATLYGSSTVAAAVLRHGAGTDEAGGHLSPRLTLAGSSAPADHQPGAWPVTWRSAYR